MKPSIDGKRALRFVILMGVVNLFADMTYEGGRGVSGAFLGHLGASGAIVGIVAGGGELAGYSIRWLSGAVADRTGLYWLDVWVGYAINVLCVPALALAGSWPAAAGLFVGERLGRGVRKPVTSAMLAEAGRLLGSGRVFGFNEALDQTGATVGPLVVALAIAHGGYRAGFGVLIVPALLTLGALAIAATAGKNFTPREDDAAPVVRDWPAFRRYAIGGALVAAGYVDFALIAVRFQRDHVVGVAAISIWFAVAMAVGAIAAPILGRLFDRIGNLVIGVALVLTSAATPLAFLGNGAAAKAGVALWGIGIAVQDSLLAALVASVIVKRRTAKLFGLYDLVFGLAWFVGSAIAGILLDRSVLALAIFSTLLTLCAVPFFVWPPNRPLATRMSAGIGNQAGMKVLLSVLAAAGALVAFAPAAYAQAPPPGAGAAPPYVDSSCGAWQADTWVPNGDCASTVYKHERIAGTIVSVKGHLVTLQLTDRQVVIDDTIALRDQSTGRVAVGRRIIAHGYWQDGNFYATIITTGPAGPPS